MVELASGIAVICRIAVTAEWAQAVTALLAFIAAAIAAGLLKRQIDAQRHQHTVELSAAHRPAVVIREAWFARGMPMDPDKWYLWVHLVNVGPGLANQIEICAWIRELSGSTTEEIDRLRDEVASTEPEFHSRVGALASHEPLDWSMALKRNPPVRVEQGVRPPVVLYTATYIDVFKKPWPEDKRPSSIMMSPEWRRERPG